MQRQALALRREQKRLLERLAEIERRLAGMNAGLDGARSPGRAATVDAGPAEAASMRARAVISQRRALELLQKFGHMGATAVQFAQVAAHSVDEVLPVLNALLAAGKIQSEQGVYWVETKS